jgi:hypothetical protein
MGRKEERKKNLIRRTVFPVKRKKIQNAAFRAARWYFQTKNPNLGKFCRVLQWKMFI